MSKKGFSGLLVTVIFVAVMVSFGAIHLTTEYLKESEIVITVKDKERVVYSKSSQYLIWTENEVFRNTDTLMKWKFNSSDLQGKLEKGKTYRCKVYGWRINIFSKYRNLISCEEAEK
jgi:hypothetical protein